MPQLPPSLSGRPRPQAALFQDQLGQPPEIRPEFVDAIRSRPT
jgi:hypothetical protein